MPWSKGYPSSHCVPGAISNGPMSGSTSIVVTSNASELSRRPVTRLGRRGEVPVPRLVDRARVRHVEADLHEDVALAEDGVAHGRDPRVRDEVEEAANRFGMDLDVVAVATAADGAARRASASSYWTATSSASRATHSRSKRRGTRRCPGRRSRP
jgi:hypothetical protein